MIIFNRKLKKRLLSLEEYLGVYFQSEYGTHEDNKWSVIEKLRSRVDKIEGKKK